MCRFFLTAGKRAVDSLHIHICFSPPCVSLLLLQTQLKKEGTVDSSRSYTPHRTTSRRCREELCQKVLTSDILNYGVFRLLWKSELGRISYSSRACSSTTSQTTIPADNEALRHTYIHTQQYSVEDKFI